VPAIPAGLSQTLASLGKLGPLNTPPAAHATAAPAPNAASDLIKSLMQAGLLSNPALGGAAASPKVEQDADYAAAILSLDIKFTSADLQREPPVGALELVLHKHLPQQCRQCANRYPPGPRGQRSMDEHLDWHFRQNRRAKDSAARGQSRSWFSKLSVSRVMRMHRNSGADRSFTSTGSAEASTMHRRRSARAPNGLAP
jgi:pre-mRNA cleavage complex 2 protein Pcf11